MIELCPPMLDFHFEVRKLEDENIPLFNKFNELAVKNLLKEFFGIENDRSFEFYEVKRPGYGIDHSIPVFSPSPNHEYFTLRAFPKPELGKEPVSFNQAVYRRDRVKTLITALRDHYPATYFLDTNDFLLILQRFVFSPVCRFENMREIKELLEIIQLASSACILLDFNENHWLIKGDGRLIYTDTDYMGPGPLKDNQKALEENLNQSMVFFNENNCQFLSNALNQLSRKENGHKSFVKDFIKTLETFLLHWKSIDITSDSLKKKIICLEQVVTNTKI